MARKKIVFVIVEGPSDDTALSVILNKIFSKDNVFVHITHGDITTETDVNSTNIVTRIFNEVKKYADSNHLKKMHFRQIIHLLDMDGAYIPDTAIIDDPQAEKAEYYLDKICTKNVEKIKLRNEKKRGCLNRISIITDVCNIPYQAYYMSCNLDHVLFNSQNLSDDEKENYAYAFAKQYKDDIPSFVQFISDDSFAMKASYTDTWAYIKKELHSLERHSNFNLCIDLALSEETQDFHQS